MLLRTCPIQGTRKSLEHRCNDDEGLRAELSMQGEVGQHVVGRSVYVADSFVSYGDVLVPTPQWETCEGTWFRNTSGSQRGQEVRIMAVKNGGLLCVLTGRWQSPQDLHWAGAGKSHRLAGTSANVPAGTPATTSTAGSRSVAALRLWRQNYDGHAELNVAEGDADCEDWQPCELRFHDGLSRFTVVCWPKGRSRLVLTYERQLQETLCRGRFRGVDLVFDSSFDKAWPLCCGENVRDISLHMAAVDEKRHLLQLVYSLCIHAPAALTVPVPSEHLSEVQRYVARWQRHVQPLEPCPDEGQPHTSTAGREHAFMAMFDIMVAVVSYANVLVSAVVLQKTDQDVVEASTDFECAGFADNALPIWSSGVGPSSSAMLSM